MDWLLWILVGLGVGLLGLGVYVFRSPRRAERAPCPLDDSLRDALASDPLADPFAEPRAVREVGTVKAVPVSPTARTEESSYSRREPQLDDTPLAEFDELGVSQVRLRPQDEAAAVRLAAGRQRRTPRFSYKALAEDGAPPADKSARSAYQQDAVPEPDHAVPSPPRRAEANVSTPQAGQGVAGEAEPSARHESAPPSTAKAERTDDVPSVIPLYLLARQPTGFAGSTLLDVFARLGFEFGDMNVYHYSDVRGQALFSLMNGVAPGTFDPRALAGQSTPALAFFLRLPIERQPGLVLEQFLELAYRMADELNAALLDDRHEALSTESVDRMRAIVLGD